MLFGEKLYFYKSCVFCLNVKSPMSEYHVINFTYIFEWCNYKIDVLCLYMMSYYILVVNRVSV